MKTTMKGFVNCLSSIQDLYAKQGNAKHFAYGKAIKSIKDLGYKEAKRRLLNGEKIPYIGESMTSKYKEYVKTATIRKIKELQNMKVDNPHKHYMPREKAENLVKPLKKIISKYVSSDITYVGSYRRKATEVGDMDMLVVKNDGDFTKSFKLEKGDTFTIGKTKVSVEAIGPKKMKTVLKHNKDKIEVDLRIFKESEKATALMYFTGSQEENIKLRSVAKRNNMKLSEYGVTTLNDGKLHHFKTEKAVYKYLGCTYKEPWER